MRARTRRRERIAMGHHRATCDIRLRRRAAEPRGLRDRARRAITDNRITRWVAPLSVHEHLLLDVGTEGVQPSLAAGEASAGCQSAALVIEQERIDRATRREEMQLILLDAWRPARNLALQEEFNGDEHGVLRALRTGATLHASDDMSASISRRPSSRCLW